MIIKCKSIESKKLNVFTCQACERLIDHYEVICPFCGNNTEEERGN